MTQKNPHLADVIVLQNGGQIETEAGTAIISVSSSGVVTQTVEDITLTGDLTIGDSSADTLTVNATSTFSAPVTVGEDDTGYDVIFYGATSGSNLTWDESADSLILNDAGFDLISTDAGATVGPVLELYRNSASPATNDVLGQVLFTGEDDGGNKTSYGAVGALALAVTDGTESGGVGFKVAASDDGALEDVLAVSSDGTTVNLILGDALGGGGATAAKITTPSSSNADLTLEPDGTGETVITNPALGDGTTAGEYVQTQYVIEYDFAVDGGTAGAITPAKTVTLPDNFIVRGMVIDVITAVTSGTSTADVSVSVPTDGDITIATTVTDPLWGPAGVKDLTVLGKTNLVKTTASRTVQVTVANENLTAGNFVCYLMGWQGQ